MIDINQILEKAPSKIAEYAEKENQSYSKMIFLHEEYKRLRAKLYLERRAQDEKTAIKELDYQLDYDSELAKIKDEELRSEIDYRGWKIKKEKADNLFQSAMELGRNARKEMSSLSNTIYQPKKEV